jgi:hypothetical protein
LRADSAYLEGWFISDSEESIVVDDDDGEDHYQAQDNGQNKEVVALQGGTGTLK